MADVHTKEQRSFNMSRIRSKDTKPEMLVRKFLHAHGFRFRLHVKDLPGKPDIVLPKYKTVIFVHGCFWHGHDSCYLFKWPKSRSEFWYQKINKNIARDRTNQEKLLELGWRVLIWWECNIRSSHDFELGLTKTVEWIKGNQSYMEIR